MEGLTMLLLQFAVVSNTRFAMPGIAAELGGGGGGGGKGKAVVETFSLGTSGVISCKAAIMEFLTFVVSMGGFWAAFLTISTQSNRLRLEFDGTSLSHS